METSGHAPPFPPFSIVSTRASVKPDAERSNRHGEKERERRWGRGDSKKGIMVSWYFAFAKTLRRPIDYFPAQTPRSMPLFVLGQLVNLRPALASGRLSYNSGGVFFQACGFGPLSTASIFPLKNASKILDGSTLKLSRPLPVTRAVCVV